MKANPMGPGGADPFLLPLHTVGARHGHTGEQRLLLALLCDAMQAYAAELARQKRPHRLRELKRWFESTDRSYVFSFESVCDALGLDVGYVRRRVLQTEPTRVRRAWGHRVHAHRIVAPRVRRSPTESAPAF
jgi:hypothetical protein